MAVSAVDNSGMKNYRDVGITGFVPSLTYEYDAAAKEVSFVDATTYKDDAPLKLIHFRVHDRFGAEVRTSVTAPEDSGDDAEGTVSVASLNTSKPLDITATIICDDGDKTVADLGAYDIGAAGTVNSADAQKNA